MLAHRANAIDEMLRATVPKVVAVDTRDHDVAKFERRDRPGEIDRLFAIERQRAAVADVAERAAARADIAHDHEGRRAFAEALADVRARRLLAHGVQVVLAQDLLDFATARR